MVPAALQLAFEALMGAIGLFNLLRKNARQDKELTPEQDAEFDRKIERKFKEPHWTPEPK